MSKPEELLATAEEGARIAGKILADRFHQARTIDFKGGIDLVTDADRASEAALLSFIRERHPDDAILAEESGLNAGGGVRWLVDPLDGTTNYAHHVPHFSVSIAVERDGQLLAGVVFDPMRDELFSASKGSGARLNDRPIRVSTVSSLMQALLCTGFPYDVRERPEPSVGLFARLIPRAQGLRRLGSAALDLAYVAAGRLDGYFEFGLKPWDVAAGALLVLEAGGVCEGMDAAPLDLSLGDVLTCGPNLAGELRREVGGYLEEIGWQPGKRQ